MDRQETRQKESVPPYQEPSWFLVEDNGKLPFTEEEDSQATRNDKVYVVIDGNYEDECIVAIFLKKAAAEYFCHEMAPFCPDQPRVKAYDLNTSDAPFNVIYGGIYEKGERPVVNRVKISPDLNDGKTPSARRWSEKCGHVDHLIHICERFLVNTNQGFLKALEIAKSLKTEALENE